MLKSSPRSLRLMRELYPCFRSTALLCVFFSRRVCFATIGMVIEAMRLFMGRCLEDGCEQVFSECCSAETGIAFARP